MTEKRRPVLILGVLVGCTMLVSGCREFVTDSARTSIADFFTTVLTEAVNTAILPD